MIPIIIVAILAAAVVGAIVFFALQNKLDFLSEQTDRKLEVFQNKYEGRIQQSSQALQESYREQLNHKIEEVKQQVESSAADPAESVQALQENYQAQLTQTTNELKQQLDASLLESVQSSEARYQEQLTQATHELKEELESNFRNELQSLEAKYQADLELAHQKIDQLEQAHQSPIPDQVKNLEKTEDSSGETGNELVELLEEAETNQDEPQQVVKDEILPEPSQPEQPMVTETPIITDQPSQSDQDLDETITALENYAQASDIPQLSNYINHPESLIRGSIASALGKIAAAQGLRAEIKQAIPLMGKLIQDPQPSVRKSAVEALSNIKSEKVIPLLERALRDPDSDVVKSASAGISQFKSYRRTPKPKPAKKTVKPSKP
ncbi:HEAT repeat domain-containing protein [Moorena sp. SIO3H5]|uniref:HEAT repeat domain-containing protein n=1 Tax=Moorena sp. SIO3H5 TaxID=2607834 RepID=UPI0013BA5C81|nr:HEAT repeat domain-containing protein [Moorena sp. SIO3H5]NEO71050.1 hypothetical protein [Moorena sp. SIO3H5]